jgi:hypothetical protein
MRVRLFIEVELDDATLLTQFGARLPTLTASRELEAGLARATENLVKQLPTVSNARIVFIPELL